MKKNGDGLTKKAIDEMYLFKKGLMNWGSEDLIKKYIEYEGNLDIHKGDTSAILNNADGFLRNMRKELGFKDSKSLKLMSLLLKPEARTELGQ